jgi:hypothetical protein
MIIKLDKTGSQKEFNKILDEMLKNKKIKSIFILSCDKNNFKASSLNKKLKGIKLPIFGGVFPEILFGKEKMEKGTIVVGFFIEPKIQIIPNLSNYVEDFEETIEADFSFADETKIMFVFVDGFAKKISVLVDSLFNVFGLEFNYIGGGAGSLSMKQKPCLFTNKGLLQDSALLVQMNLESGVGVSHGWESIRGPYKVTEAENNIIKTLDWKPAFEVYRDVVEKHSGQIFNKTNFFDIAKGYPFGISKLNAEKVVRDPFALGANNSLVCVGEVFEESFVDILTGDCDSLVNAAHQALSIANDAFKSKSNKKTVLFIDCISRVLFLGNNFVKELNAVYMEGVPLIGALTIGEIANNGKDYLEFYNKTSVVGILGE